MLFLRRLVFRLRCLGMLLGWLRCRVGRSFACGLRLVRSLAGCAWRSSLLRGVRLPLGGRRLSRLVCRSVLFARVALGSACRFRCRFARYRLWLVRRCLASLGRSSGLAGLRPRFFSISERSPSKINKGKTPNKHNNLVVPY